MYVKKVQTIKKLHAYTIIIDVHYMQKHENEAEKEVEELNL